MFDGIKVNKIEGVINMDIICNEFAYEAIVYKEHIR
jgi:hypothetical protein